MHQATRSSPSNNITEFKLQIHKDRQRLGAVVLAVHCGIDKIMCICILRKTPNHWQTCQPLDAEQNFQPTDRDRDWHQSRWSAKDHHPIIRGNLITNHVTQLRLLRSDLYHDLSVSHHVRNKLVTVGMLAPVPVESFHATKVTASLRFLCSDIPSRFYDHESIFSTISHLLVLPGREWQLINLTWWDIAFKSVFYFDRA